MSITSDSNDDDNDIKDDSDDEDDIEEDNQEQRETGKSNNCLPHIQSTLLHSEVQSSLRSEFTLVGEYSDETADYHYGVGGDDNIYHGK